MHGSYALSEKINAVPFYAILGETARDDIPVMYAVDWMSGYEKAEYWSERGVDSFMVKVGEDVEKDIKALRRIRDFLPEDKVIVVDPNQGYSVMETLRLAREAGDCFDAIEGPVDKDDYAALAGLTRELSQPLIADETVTSKNNVARLIREDACDMMLLKLLRAGGFRTCMQMAGLAEEAGKKVYCASMTNLGVGEAAILHFASAVPNLTSMFGNGLENLFQIYGPGMEYVREKDISTHHKYEKGSWTVGDEPGIGVEVDYDRICGYQNRETLEYS